MWEATSGGRNPSEDIVDEDAFILKMLVGLKRSHCEFTLTI